ncbi:U11/U12 small nuclear ribonucleoprotein 48 kDa protein [Spatholobus suberectus]|nr:U11/U12 small nuclear ribonucleoprotein 48 kDa protein [Spatholobus suberectus]
MNPSPSPNLSSTLSSLNNLIALSDHVLCVSPSPPTLKANLIECPFNPHHLVPPHSLFLHHLRCPSSPRPPRPPPDLTHSLTYPKTLHNSPSDQLSFYLDSLSNFFYRDCPAVVAFSHADALTRTATLALPSFLSLECADTDTHPDRVSHHAPILPSQYFSIARELECWNDFPTTYSNSVLRAVSGVGIANDRDLTDWIIANSPRYGVVIDTAMQQHIFLLCCLCLKSILREASVSVDSQNSHADCPVSNQALTWLASQVSILYGATNGRAFVLNFVKKCIMVGASVLLLYPLGDEAASKQASQNLGTDSGDIEDAKPAAECGEKKNCVLNRKIFVSQVAAAVAALHERSLLEQKIKGFWFSQQPSNYQLVAEHSYLSEKANEERFKRPDYRPVIDHDGLHRQQSFNQETSGEKTREELLAEERDYKRRRMSYRGKKSNQSPVQVMRYMIEDYMEQIKQAGGFESPVKMFVESGLFPSKPPGHDIPMEANNSRKVSHDSPQVTISNPRCCEQQSHSGSCDKSKTVEDAFSRDYKHHKHEHHRSHYYREDQRNADRGRYHRDRPSTSPERYLSHSRSCEHNSHHNKQDYYSNRKKYDNSSRIRDRWQKDTHRSHISDSLPNNAFSDRYDPSESLDICKDDNSSDAIKSDKFYDKEHY